MKNYWDERLFKSLHGEYQRTRAFDLVERITADFFIPLARNYQAGGEITITHGDREEIAQIAAIRCFQKIDLFNPALGSGFNFFTKIVHRVTLAEEIKATARSRRFVSLDAPLAPE